MTAAERPLKYECKVNCGNHFKYTTVKVDSAVQDVYKCLVRVVRKRFGKNTILHSAIPLLER